jgi:hypothetical protein
MVDPIGRLQRQAIEKKGIAAGEALDLAVAGPLASRPGTGRNGR